MSFDTARYLRKATSRAKSDVANKLISMLLHEISRRAVASLGMSVTDAEYVATVVEAFADRCAYCDRSLEQDRASVEHLEGMNRFRAGLHIPGNVVVACLKCNREKRRDDQLPVLALAKTGWASFLSHDSTRCKATCKTCAYWITIWPDAPERHSRLGAATDRIAKFRENYAPFLIWSTKAQRLMQAKLASVYAESQELALIRIRAFADSLFAEIISADDQS